MLLEQYITNEIEAEFSRFESISNMFCNQSSCEENYRITYSYLSKKILVLHYKIHGYKDCVHRCNHIYCTSWHHVKSQQTSLEENSISINLHEKYHSIFLLKPMTQNCVTKFNVQRKLHKKQHVHTE